MSTRKKLRKASLRRLRTFGLKLEVVFYDTTSTYFEGKGPEGLAKRGFSKDNHPENSQVVIGVLMRDEGIPIGCEVYPGNFHDAKTLRIALYDLSRRFKIRRIISVPTGAWYRKRTSP